MSIVYASRKRSSRTCNSSLASTPRKLQKVIDRTLQQRAFNDLLQIRNNKGGILEYGDISESNLRLQRDGV
jgi:hypothetical protein